MKKLLTIIFVLLLTLTLIPISIISNEVEAENTNNYGSSNILVGK